MKAAIYRSRGEIEVVDIAKPEADDGRALVGIDFCGICGTDLHMVIDGWGTPGSVFGHEWSGRIVDPGGSGLAIGATVVAVPSVACGHCERCREGRTSLCLNRPAAGNGPERGAFAAFVDLDPARLLEVPDGVDARAAAYTEPLAVALHAVTLSDIADNQRALVFGAGPIGAAIIAILRTRGIDVAAVEPGDKRGALAEALGASVWAPADVTAPGHPGETLPDGFDAVFETSGVRAAVESGLGQLVGGGVLMLVGTGLDFPKLDTNRIILNELQVTGAFNYDPNGFQDALALIASGALPLDLLIEPDTVDLHGVLDAMQRLRAGELPGKVMVTP
jgi:threonine dehydrogenase-like Zn-dependent dehydrogenase